MKNSKSVLKRFFNLKKERNPKYSVRALARDVGVSPSFMSLLLNGKRGVPRERMDDLCKVLAIDDVGRAQLEKIDTSNAVEKVNEVAIATSFKEISPKHRGLFSEWYYLAILNLVECTEFDEDPKWVANRLGIHIQIAQSAWQKLLSLKLVEKKEGRWRKTNRLERHISDKAYAEKARYFGQHFAIANDVLKSRRSIEDFQLRLINGATVSTNAENVKKARAMLNQTLVEISEVLAEGEADSVYQLSIQLTPLTK